MSKYEHVTDRQAEYIATLVNERYAEDAPERVELRKRFFALRTGEQIDGFITDLKAVPTLQQQEWNRQREADRQARANRPSEEGLYRNPETGELYRVRRDSRGETYVSKYSLTGGPRRLLADDSEIVKGKWKRLGSWDSRRTLLKIHKDWLIDPKTLAQEFAYGFCPLHYGPLSDAVSVILGYGPDCAEKHGLPWGEEVARRKLAERRAGA